MKEDSLNVDNLLLLTESTKEVDKVWLYYIIGFVISIICISFYVWRYYHSERFYLKRQLWQDKSEPDFRNMIDSAFMAKKLYDKLKGRCHPDNFSTDMILFDKATEIFALLGKHQYNYRELNLLKERAEKELNINI